MLVGFLSFFMLADDEPACCCTVYVFKSAYFDVYALLIMSNLISSAV